MTIKVKYPIKRQRQTLRMLGIDPRSLSAAEIAEGAEAARRVTACEYVPGANKRRPQAVADWQAFVRRVRSREASLQKFVDDLKKGK